MAAHYAPWVMDDKYFTTLSLKGKWSYGGAPFLPFDVLAIHPRCFGDRGGRFGERGGVDTAGGAVWSVAGAEGTRRVRERERSERDCVADGICILVL